MIRKAIPADAHAIAVLAVKIWDSHTCEELEHDFRALLEEGSAVCFLLIEDGEPHGFAQCGLRHDYVEGTASSPVGYLEGIFVDREYRHRGSAGKLLGACEAWASEQGCTEFASDCELENDASLSFHLSHGFEEAGRIICFKKVLK